MTLTIPPCAGLLYGQARAVLAGPRGKELARRAVDALGANGGQRFVTQARFYIPGDYP